MTTLKATRLKICHLPPRCNQQNRRNLFGAGMNVCVEAVCQCNAAAVCQCNAAVVPMRFILQCIRNIHSKRRQSMDKNNDAQSRTKTRADVGSAKAPQPIRRRQMHASVATTLCSMRNTSPRARYNTSKRRQSMDKKDDRKKNAPASTESVTATQPAKRRYARVHVALLLSTVVVVQCEPYAT